MSGERAPNDAVQPDDQTEPWLDMGIVVALLGGGPAPDSPHADAAGPVVEELAVEPPDRP